MEKETLLKLLPNRSWNSIKQKSNNIGENRSHDFSRDSYMNILLEDKLESFYWIGFLLADGHFSKKERIKLHISIKDLNHLKRFAEYLNCSNVSIKNNMCLVSLQNKKICPILCNKFDINSNKTHNPPNFNLFNFDKYLLFSLIIGFIDGDGCINKVYKREDSNIRIKVHKSWLNNLIFIEKFLYNYFSINIDKTLSKINNSGYSILTLSNNVLLKKIKKECIRLNLPIMIRKWDNIDENKLTRSERLVILKKEILELQNNFNNTEIIKMLGISKKTFYKHINSDYFLNLKINI
jgi:hypothetical protein